MNKKLVYKIFLSNQKIQEIHGEKKEGGTKNKTKKPNIESLRNSGTIILFSSSRERILAEYFILSSRNHM